MRVLNSNFELQIGDKIKFAKIYKKQMLAATLNGEITMDSNFDFSDSFIVEHIFIDGGANIADSNKKVWYIQPTKNNYFVNKVDIKVVSCKIFKRIQ